MSAHKKRTFVKYRNRKLHEVGVKTPYTPMEELLVIVAGGDLVEIVDDASGEDLTAFTLSRLVYERSRVDKDAYTVSALRHLIMSSPPPKRKSS